jgi:hypothetical protein
VLAGPMPKSTTRSCVGQIPGTVPTAYRSPTLDQVMADSSVFLGPEASSLFV